MFMWKSSGSSLGSSFVSEISNSGCDLERSVTIFYWSWNYLANCIWDETHSLLWDVVRRKSITTFIVSYSAQCFREQFNVRFAIKASVESPAGLMLLELPSPQSCMQDGNYLMQGCPIQEEQEPPEAVSLCLVWSSMSNLGAVIAVTVGSELVVTDCLKQDCCEPWLQASSPQSSEVGIHKPLDLIMWITSLLTTLHRVTAAFGLLVCSWKNASSWFLKL